MRGCSVVRRVQDGRMHTHELLLDAARRPQDAAASVLAGITDETLHALPDGRGSSIAWLVWHAARQQDVQIAELAAVDQVWVTGDWAARLGVHRGPDALGFGDAHADVAELHIADPALLLAYLNDVVDAVCAYASGLTQDDLAEVIDTSWDPPVTRGVRIVSTIDDMVIHVGQAAYVRGLLEGWSVGY